MPRGSKRQGEKEKEKEKEKDKKRERERERERERKREMIETRDESYLELLRTMRIDSQLFALQRTLAHYSVLFRIN